MGMANPFPVLQLSLSPTHAHENIGTVSSPSCIVAINWEELLNAPATMLAPTPRSKSTPPPRELPSPNTSFPTPVASPPHLPPLSRRSSYPAPSKLVFNFRLVVLVNTSRKVVILNTLELLPRSTSLPYWST